MRLSLPCKDACNTAWYLRQATVMTLMQRGKHTLVIGRNELRDDAAVDTAAAGDRRRQRHVIRRNSAGGIPVGGPPLGARLQRPAIGRQWADEGAAP